MLGQNHGIATAPFSVESGCDPLETQQIIVLTQCSRFPPSPKTLKSHKAEGFGSAQAL